MTYEKQTWNKYDDLKTEEENIQNGAVVTDNRMNHMEEGISTIDLEITSHESNKTNPHSVTKEQVGLSNVSNYGVATEAEAIAGTSNAKYMTPSLTKEAAKSYVDKTDVGLSNVDNIKQASKSEFDDHTANKTNPHGVTAAQVGAYTKSETDAKFKTVNDLIISQDIPGGANLDDYKTEGEFSKKTPTVVTGAPEGVTGAFRLSVRAMVGSSGIFQTLYDYATRAIYYRIGNTSLGFNLPWQRIANNSEVVHLTGDETIAGKKTFTGAVQVSGNSVFGVGSNEGWYEEQLDINYYRWSKVVVHSNIDITNGYRTSFFISAAISFPAAPNGVTFDIKSAVVGASSNSGVWYFPDGGNTYRLISTASIAGANARVIITAYGTKT